MNQIKFYLTFLLTIPVYCLAQDLSNFEPLRAEAPIPADITKLSSEKFLEKKERIDQDLKRRERKEQEAFFLESTFVVDKLLLDGKVLFNDPLSDYVQSVLANILDKNDSLYKELQVYVVKSPYVNAFATDRGALFVNVGLLAQLSNEAELAYVLCHEIVHYLEDHSMSGYIETKRIYNEKANYRRISEDEKIFEKSRYSKELEGIADEKGFQLFQNTEYDPELIVGVFDVLQYSYLPFDDIEFNDAFLENEYYRIPKDYYPEKTAPILSNDDYDDSKSSHPNIKTRRAEIIRLISENKGGDSKKEFINPKEEFVKAQTLARFELSHLYLSNLQYAKAIYNSFLLLRDYPNNKFLKTNIAYALYAVSLYKNQLFNSAVEDSDDVQGKSQSVYSLIENMDASELSILANAYIWELQKEYPEDDFLSRIAIDAMQNMVLVNELSIDQFIDDVASNSDTNSKIEKLSSKEYEELSKYDKILLQEEKNETGDSSFYAFVDLFSYPKFRDSLESFSLKLEETKNEKRKSRKELKKERKAKRKQLKLVQRKGRALGIDKIVLKEPEYLKIDQRKDVKTKYVDTEAQKLKLKHSMKRLADKAGLETEMIGTKGTLDSGSISIYNNNAFLNDWVQERSNHGNVNIIPYESRYAQNIINKYGTNYFLYSGLFDVRDKNKFNTAYLAISLLYVVPLPFFIYSEIKPHFETYFYSILFDIENGQALLVNDNYLYTKSSKDLRNLSYYDTFYQIKSSRK